MSSKAHMPPVPPENRSPHGGNNPGQGELDPKQAKGVAEQRSVDPGKQGQTGNTGVNTHHQGYQQDR